MNHVGTTRSALGLQTTPFVGEGLQTHVWHTSTTTHCLQKQLLKQLKVGRVGLSIILMHLFKGLLMQQTIYYIICMMCRFTAGLLEMCSLAC